MVAKHVPQNKRSTKISQIAVPGGGPAMGSALARLILPGCVELAGAAGLVPPYGSEWWVSPTLRVPAVSVGGGRRCLRRNP